MIPYDELVGRLFNFGFQDCYSLVRDFYQLEFDISLPNYARPRDFWKHGMDMYHDRFERNGFEALHCHPSEYQFGDVCLLAIHSTTANHAGLLVENGMLFHHFTGRLSERVPYRGLWGKNSTTAVLRHKAVELPKVVTKFQLSPASQARR